MDVFVRKPISGARLRLFVAAGACGDRHDGQAFARAFALADHPRHLEAVHAGQVQIEQHHVEVRVAQFGQGAEAVRDVGGAVALRVE